MLRPAVPADLARLVAIRDKAGGDALSDPALASDETLRRLIAAGAATVWDDEGAIAGFAAVDDGGSFYLLVDAAQRSRGVGRALLAWACEAAKEAGQAAAVVTLAPGGSAEGHYRAAGWVDAGRSASGGLVLKKPL